MEIKLKIKIPILLITTTAFGILLTGCASEGMPDGGPKDETGPSLIATVPVNGALNVKTNTDLLFEFSEPVNYKSVENSLSVFPAMENRPTVKISRNKVRILLGERLKENTTYIFSFGRKIEDYQGNKTEGETKIAFSTGDIMDRSLVTGHLFGYQETKATAYILFYNRNQKGPDSLIYYQPDYYTSVDNEGNFRASNLAAGKYAMVAYPGSFKDFPRYNEEDQTAVGFTDFIEISTGNDTLNNINMRLHQYPLHPFEYIKGFEEGGHIKLMFSHKIDHEKTLEPNIRINSRPVGKNWWFDSSDPDKICLNFTGLDSADYIITVGNIFDVYRRPVAAAVDTLTWTNPEVIDTLGPGAKFVTATTKDFDIHETIQLTFTEPVPVVDDLTDRISFMDADSQRVAFDLLQKNLLTYTIKPRQPLNYFTEYKLMAVTDSIFDLYDNNCRDSIINTAFTTIDEDLFGAVSGKIDTWLSLQKIVVGCEHADDANVTATAKPDAGGNYTFPRLLPGDYKMFIFYDENENGSYDWGSLVPYRPAEKFKRFSMPVTVRSRWETERVGLKF